MQEEQAFCINPPPPPSSPPGPFSVLAPKARSRAEPVEVLHAVVATSPRRYFTGGKNSRNQRMQDMIHKQSLAESPPSPSLDHLMDPSGSLQASAVFRSRRAQHLKTHMATVVSRRHCERLLRPRYLAVESTNARSNHFLHL